MNDEDKKIMSQYFINSDIIKLKDEICEIQLHLEELHELSHRSKETNTYMLNSLTDMCETHKKISDSYANTQEHMKDLESKQYTNEIFMFVIGIFTLINFLFATGLSKWISSILA